MWQIYLNYHERMGILLLKKRVNRDKCKFTTKQRMFGVFAIDEILCYRWTPFVGSRTLCHPGQWVFHGSRLVFHGFMVVGRFLLIPGCFFWFFMIPGPVFVVSGWFLWFSWLIMVPGRFFMIGFYGFSWFQGGLYPSWALEGRNETLRTPKRYLLNLYFGPKIPLSLTSRRLALVLWW